jgi:membrane protein
MGVTMNIKRDLVPLLKETGSEFQKDEAGQLGAALAYYAMFSMFPLLLLLVAMLGYVLRYWDDAIDVREQILSAVAQNFSSQMSDTLREVLKGVEQRAGGATIIGLITLLIGASGAFQQLDLSFNKIWNVPERPKSTSIVASALITVRQKLFSFGMVLAVGFLLLVSLALTGISQALLDSFESLPVVGGAVGYIGSLVVALLLNTLVFALLFKYLPDTKVLWGDVALGALVTAVVWEIGKRLLALYIGRLGSGYSAYGTVGAVLVLMAWIYFSSQILFLGAEFTEVYSRRHGSRAPAAQPETATTPAPTPAALPAPPEQPASSTGTVAVATGAGLLIGALGGAIAGAAALLIGTRRAIAPITRRLRRGTR